VNQFPYSIVITLVALAFVLVLAWFVIKFLSGINRFRGSVGEVKVCSSTMLGTRERLVVVTFRDHDYLLGVTSEQISIIDKLPLEQSASPLGQD